MLLFSAENALTGEIPTVIGDMKSLNVVDLRKPLNDKLSCVLPYDKIKLTNLENCFICMVADGNLFSGTIPPEIGKLHQLRILNLCKFE